MKKKLKVQKAFRGKFARRRPGVQQQPFQPLQPRPGVIVDPAGPRQPGLINTFNSTPFPRQPGQINTFNSTPFPRGEINPAQVLPPMQPSSQIDPSSPRSLPFASAVGPSMQGVGDPRLGAATIPGNQAQMMMRGTTQAAPVQPVPAMKKGGVVRGGRAEIKGLRPAKIT